jgi:hypothetical protein
MSTAVVSPDPKQLAAMAQRAPTVQVVEFTESRAAQVRRIAKERLRAKLSNLAPADLLMGLHCMTERMHGHALRAAFQESPEALGDLVMTVIAHEMELQAEIEAEQIVEQIEGAERATRPVRMFRITGEDC